MVDAKPYIRHHPLLGYEYIPGYRQALPQPGGGHYVLAINAAGIRASREYSVEKPAGKKRLLVFGDSFAAGQYVSNEDRFSELLERRLPEWEVINFGLEGTGTDQQLLIYQEVGSRYEHDAVLLMPFLQNIRRNLVEAREGFDPRTHEKKLLGKPRFELVSGKLELRGVPVPTERTTTRATNGAESNGGWKAKWSRLPGMNLTKRLIYSIAPWEPFPEYRRSDTPAWLLMEAILNRFGEVAQPRPFFIVPAFYVSYVTFRMARNYLQRFSEFAARRPNVRIIDLLPSFRALGDQAVRAFFEPEDCHYSPLGHLTVADALASALALAEPLI